MESFTIALSLPLSPTPSLSVFPLLPSPLLPSLSLPLFFLTININSRMFRLSLSLFKAVSSSDEHLAVALN